MKGLFLLHVTVSLLMTGIIWFVQLIHYPLFHKVPQESFPSFEVRHTQLTGYLIAPLMLLELGTAIGLVWMHPTQFTQTYWLANLVLLALIWASTFFIQVPLHQQLSQAFSQENIRRLVNSNWIRTILWSIRGGLLLYLLYES